MSAERPTALHALAIQNPPRQCDDYAFLPAALEVLETPLSPIRTSMVLTLCGLLTAAVGIGYFARVDVIATAQGKVQPIGRTKTVQPAQSGRVHRVAVENGQAVQVGDLLMALDPSEIRADEAELMAVVQGWQGEAVRRKAALLAAAEPTVRLQPVVDWGDLPQAVRLREERVLAGDLLQLAGQIATLQARKAQAAAEAERLRGTIAVQEMLSNSSKERLDMRSELLMRNDESKASVIDAEEAYRTQLATLVAEKGQLREREAAQAVAEAEFNQVRQVFLAENATKLAESERRLASDDERLAKVRLKLADLELRSPVNGRVSGLTVTTPGQVVSAGEQVMQIVPDDGRLEIEAYLPNDDAGFVRPGQQAIVKVQAFPFTDYGTIAARVVRVAEDAIPLSEAAEREGNPVVANQHSGFGGAQRVQNLVYPVTLSLDRSTLGSDNSGHLLSPGMTVVAEVRTGSRRLLAYLMTPLLEITGSAFREP